MKNNSYAYIHRRLDTFEVFYVGIGSIYPEHKNSKKHNTIYFRAYSKKGRTKWWNKIISKVNYNVEIIQENISWEEACELETFLISLYGRKDKSLGNLVNMTDGGEGALGRVVSDEEKENLRIINTGKKWSQESKNKARISHLGDKNPMFGVKRPNINKGRVFSEKSKELMRVKRPSITGINHSHYGKPNLKLKEYSKSMTGELSPMFGKIPHNAKIVLNIDTGIYYDSLKDASRYSQIKYSNLKKYLSGIYANKTSLIYC